MTIEEQYAEALHELVAAEPAKASHYLKNLAEVLNRRGHQKLLPRILAAYERHEQATKRAESYRATTPEEERTRVLLELYRTLIATP